MSSIIKRDDQSLSLKEKLQMRRNRVALVIDRSGSMDEDVEPGSSKMQRVRAIVKGITSKPVIIVFDDEAFEVPQGQPLPEPAGGTFLSSALALMQSMGIKKGVIISDGEVDGYDQDRCLDMIRKLGLQIQVLYVGLGPKPEFLEKLANMSGGFCSQEDLHKVDALTEKVQLLLTAGNTGSGDIQL